MTPRVTTVEARHGAAGLRTDCDVLVNTTLERQPEPAEPDDTLTRILSARLRVGFGGGRHCLTGAGGDRSLLTRSAAELVTAQSGYVKAEARISTLWGANGRSSS